MGLFDRFRKKPGESDEGDKSFFLDADKSSSLGDVDFMRRSNTIRRTFPGTAENPGMKERIEDVASMEAQMAKVSEGLPEAGGNQSVARVDPGVPKPVKKTFAQPMSQQELKERMKGSALGTNVPGTSSKSAPAPAAQPSEPAAAPQMAPVPPMPAVGSGNAPAPKSAPSSAPGSAKPGSIDPFKDMLKDMR
ncbi:hypothetical protein SynMINOS11_01310 [Synechococcus sp. Minos11]|uniref:hypothetical protein n=1 Tax=Synechococcus sp. Minos11 TaxID=221341 RepID=UPI0016493CEE|nr:hypothetical protein [Synechococcus sp. Minos11]QNJ08773.1 hypothetical protein SynMINOS11_01310 [Synechococcus sp. Minos11]